MSEFTDHPSSRHEPADSPAWRADAASPRAEIRRPHRASELALVLGFLLVLGSVPLTQTALELASHEHVQFTDVFRYRPTAANLRQYEETLKEKSWFQQTLRPMVQRLLFLTLRDTGAKAVLGRDHWLFYRPDLRYLLEPQPPEREAGDSKWAPPPAHATPLENTVRAIVRFREQLQERGIALLVVPVPGKPSVYPDQVTRRAVNAQPDFRSPTLELIQSLREQGVATVDLFALFQDDRRSTSPNLAPNQLYLAQDTHWTPQGARLAAGAVAAELRRLNLAPAPTKRFQTRRVLVDRWGDILDMMQVPGLRHTFPPQRVECEQVIDPVLGPLVPPASERPGTYRFPGQKATALVLGDSFCRIYQFSEPQTLGELPSEPGTGAAGDKGRKQRWLPGSAGFVAHLALALQSPIDAIVSDGGASTDVRRKLSMNPEILEGKKVVIWEFVERDIALGARGWEAVPLPAKLD